MGYEIYYTSAPAGLRQGQAGFCTVAATDGIPKNLLERLESLSAYRHHKESGQSSPVAYAHCILQLAGTDYHVLSRICDSGMDYTGRTNALAHHVVLDATEMAEAGAAWMLGQPGVMIDRWDGRVGNIQRRGGLPRGNIGPAVCSAWRSATGDAGWAGVLVETFIKSPWKPVCLIFAPGQDILGLMAEATALVPVHQRWQVTFNTYFTSMPGNALCAWRCCMAGTPAATTTMRYAASGLVIDLTHPEKLGRPMETPWVALARTGQGDVAKLAPATKAKAAAVKAPMPPPMIREPAAPPEAEPSLADVYDLAPAPPAASAPAAAAEGEATGVIRSSDGARGRMDTSWRAERKRARLRKTLALFIIACLTIGAAAWLLILAQRSSSENLLPPPPPPPRVVAPATAPVVVKPPPVIEPVKPTTIPTPTTKPTTVPVVKLPPPRPVQPPVVIKPPQKIVLAAMERGMAGNGLRDATRTMPIPARELDNIKGVVSLRAALPSGGNDFVLRRSDLAGTFSMVRVSPNEGMGFILQWKDSLSMAAAVEVVTVRFEKTRPQLEFTWRNSVLLGQGQIAAMGYWVLQNSTLWLEDRGGRRPQPITFALPETAVIGLADISTQLSLPNDVVGPVVLRVERLPEGWRGITDEKKPGVLILDKPLPGAEVISPRFTLRFSATSKTIESDLVTCRQTTRHELDKALTEQQKIDADIKQITDNTQLVILQAQKKLERAQQRAALTPEELEAQGDTPENANMFLEECRKQLEDVQKGLELALAPYLAKKNGYDDQVRIHTAACAGYDQLDEVDVVVESPEQLRLLIVKLKNRRP